MSDGLLCKNAKNVGAAEGICKRRFLSLTCLGLVIYSTAQQNNLHADRYIIHSRS